MTEKLPVVARLYRQGRYRRASVLPGKGEPLTTVRAAEDRARSAENLLRRLVMLHERHWLSPSLGPVIDEATDERDDIIASAKALLNWEGSSENAP
jgi:hypothetical protein